MYQLYAFIAGILLLTGTVSFVYLINYGKKNSKNSLVWILICENISTILIGVFYLYCAVILSKNYSDDEKLSLISNNLENLAIFNGQEEVENFTNKPKLDDEHHNEIEDSRNNKHKDLESEFLQRYHNLVKTPISNTKRNFYERMLENRIFKNHDCFLNMFFFQGLLEKFPVYSFITSMMSLLNFCHNYYFQQSFEQSPRKIPSASTIKSTESQHGSESAKIPDNISINSSKNSIQVKPLFDDSSSIESMPNNLDVFSVKKSASTTAILNNSAQHEEKLSRKTGWCILILVLPSILVGILYMLIKSSSVASNENITNIFNYFEPNFSATHSNIVQEEILTRKKNETEQKEIALILEKIYEIINQYEDERKEVGVPAIHAYEHLKSKSSFNNIKECIEKSTILKTFDLSVILVPFFIALFYAKVTEIKMNNNTGNKKLKKYLIVFFILWIPIISDLIISRFLLNKEANLLSAFLLLWGNLNRIYTAKETIDIMKEFKSGAFIKPIENGES